MKNLRYFPFERNVFFKGKLLTVRDFELEQKYFNDKRRLVNRLVHGSGVVSGLQVVRVDDKHISVQMGVAFDGLGREIVIATPIKIRLSAIEGFNNNNYAKNAKNVYLCIAYDETKKEQVYSVASSGNGSDEIGEHNRILESYRLFIKEEAPDLSAFEANNYASANIVLYEDGEVRIWQRSPRYVNPGDVFEIKLFIEKTVETAPIRFEYKVESASFTLLSGDDGLVSFTESLDSTNTDYTISLRFKAGAPVEEGVLGIKPGSAKLSIGDREVQVEAATAVKIGIITDSVKVRIVADYYERSLDEATAFPSEQCVYLAKIGLQFTGSTYMIEKVKGVPFEEYVYNTTLLSKLDALHDTVDGGTADHFRTSVVLEELGAEQKPQFGVRYNDEANEFEFKLGLPHPRNASNEMTTGVVDIPIRAKNLRPFGKLDRSSFSEEIDHGMGQGQVCIITALEEASGDTFSDLLNSNECLYFGDHDVFRNSPYESDITHISIGTMLYPKKGTFRIGIKPQATNDKETVRVRWWAIRQLSDATGVYGELSSREAAASKDTP